jgi:hypothetical protein
MVTPTEKPESDSSEAEDSDSSVTSPTFSPFRKNAENLDHNSSKESTPEDEVEDKNLNGSNTQIDETGTHSAPEGGGGVFHAQDSGETREDGTVTPPIEGNVAHTQVGETREFVVYNGDVIQDVISVSDEDILGKDNVFIATPK